MHRLVFGPDQRDRYTLRDVAERRLVLMLECRNCHTARAMDLTKQNPRAAQIHQRYLLTGQRTCIDCHKGIAHELPDMAGALPGWSESPELVDTQHRVQ